MHDHEQARTLNCPSVALGDKRKVLIQHSVGLGGPEYAIFQKWKIYRHEYFVDIVPDV